MYAMVIALGIICSHYISFRRTPPPALPMNPVLEFALLTGVPFLGGVVVGFGARCYVSMVHRSRRQTGMHRFRM
jgi:hypothetical protein